MFDFWTSNTFFGTQRLKAHNYAKNFWVVIAPRAPPGYAYALKVVSKVEVKLNLLLLDRGLLAWLLKWAQICLLSVFSRFQSKKGCKAMMGKSFLVGQFRLTKL